MNFVCNQATLANRELGVYKVNKLLTKLKLVLIFGTEVEIEINCITEEQVLQ